MNLIKKISTFSFFSFFLLALGIAPFVGAQDNGGNGLQISPTRTELTGNPTEVKEFSISVKNVTSGTVFAKATINDFESDGVSGTPKIITDDKKTPYSISTMIKGLQDFELKPGESKTVNFSLEISSNTSPGAYFGVVRYAAQPTTQSSPEQQRQISLTASVGHLVFLTVPGTVVEQIRLESLNIANKSGNSSVFFKKPTSSSITVKNLGNGFSKPFGNLVISKGKKEVFKNEINKNEIKSIVLPNSSRTFTDDVKGISSPGKYKVVASVAYGNGGEVVNFQKSFWYLPIWFVITILLVLAIVIVGAWMMYKKASGGKAKRK